MQSKLKEFIRQLVQQQLKEMSTSAAAGPYATPYAFQDPKKKKKKKDYKLSKGMSITENYHTWKKDDSLSTKQKLGHSMREIRNRMTEIEKLVKYNVKLKNETKFQSKSYWKNTTKALNKISEKLVRLSTQIKDLV